MKNLIYNMMREDRNIIDAYTSFFTYDRWGEEKFRYIEEKVKECMKDIVGLVDGFVDQTEVREDFFQKLKQK